MPACGIETNTQQPSAVGKAWNGLLGTFTVILGCAGASLHCGDCARAGAPSDSSANITTAARVAMWVFTAFAIDSASPSIDTPTRRCATRMIQCEPPTRNVVCVMPNQSTNAPHNNVMSAT